MENVFGLYYPHVHFRDDQWLKAAALYLDRLYHLYDNFAEITLDSLTQTEMSLALADFTKAVRPNPETVDRAAERFLDAVSGTDLTCYRVPFDSPVTARDFETALAAWKIASPLVDLLKETGIARDIGRGRLGMDPGLVHAYLLTLATEMSAELGTSPLAEEAYDQAAAGLTARRLLAGLRGETMPVVEAEEQRSVLVNLAVKTVLPRDIAACPVGKIIEFRERYASERARFNESVTRLVTESEQLQGIRDKRVLLEHLQASYDSQMAPALRDLEGALRGLRIDTVTGSMNVQAAMPAAVAGSLALLAVHPSVAEAGAVGFGGLALGVWTSARRIGGTRKAALTASPVSYLFHLRHDLDPVSLAERLRQATARFSPPGPAPLSNAKLDDSRDRTRRLPWPRNRRSLSHLSRPSLGQTAHPAPASVRKLQFEP